MRYDIDRLKSFYTSPIGELTCEMIARKIGSLWPGAEGLDMMGYGHADRLLDPFRAHARRVISVSPQAQGAMRWPARSGRNSAVLAEEERLPLPDALFDRIIVCHGIEEAERPERLLRELWRVAAPEARVLFIVSHRSGLWARADSTPFGHGRPYTRPQLYRLIEDAMFQPTAFARALYAPPVNLSLFTASGEAWERIGSVLWSAFGGVLLVEAVKRVLPDPTIRAGRASRSARPQEAQKPLGATRGQACALDSSRTRGRGRREDPCWPRGA